MAHPVRGEGLAALAQAHVAEGLEIPVLHPLQAVGLDEQRHLLGLLRLGQQPGLRPQAHLLRRQGQCRQSAEHGNGDSGFLAVMHRQGRAGGVLKSHNSPHESTTCVSACDARIGCLHADWRVPAARPRSHALADRSTHPPTPRPDRRRDDCKTLQAPPMTRASRRCAPGWHRNGRARRRRSSPLLPTPASAAISASACATAPVL